MHYFGKNIGHAWNRVPRAARSSRMHELTSKLQKCHTNIFHNHTFEMVWYKFTNICFFSVRLLSVLRGHSFVSSPPQGPMTSDFEGFSIPDFIHYIYLLLFTFYLNSWERASMFSFGMFSAKQGYYWYHYYNVFGMTRSLTGNWTRVLPHSKPALYH